MARIGYSRGEMSREPVVRKERISMAKTRSSVRKREREIEKRRRELKKTQKAADKRERRLNRDRQVSCAPSEGTDVAVGQD